MYTSGVTVASASAPAALAVTGSNSLWLMVAGITAVVTGATLVRLGRSVRQVAQPN